MLELVLALLIQGAEPTEAQDNDPPLMHGGKITMTCPIGGKKYKGWTTSHYSTFGARPDGKPYGSWVFPLPMPECPDNGLVVYEQFDSAAVAKLEPIVASAEYQSMVKSDSTYYRAQWLSTRIGEDEQGALWMLLRATWQAKDGFNDPELPFEPSAEKARQYQEEFVRRVLALPVSNKIDIQILRLRAANALRELTRFDEARSVLQSVVSAKDWEADKDLDDRDRSYWDEFRDQLSRAIQRSDTSLQPIDMVEERQAAWICIDPERTMSAFDKGFCASPKMQSHVEEARKMRQQMGSSSTN